MRASPRRRNGQLYLSYSLRGGKLSLLRIRGARAASMGWPRHLPANTAAPSLGGQPVEGNTLRASPGSWKARPAFVTYDWARCDSSGHACKSVAHSGGRTRALGASDAGATVRVLVIASNRHGSSVAVSTQTSAVSASPSGPAPPSVPTPPPWFVGDFETGDLSQWGYLGDAHGVSVVSAPTSSANSRHAAKAETTDAPDSSTTGDASYVETGSFNLPWENEGSDAWFSMAVLLPSGSNPAYPGTFTPSPSSGWNMFMEWHVSPGVGGSSPYVGVRNSAGAPRLVFRLAGGAVGNPQMRWVDDPVPLQFDHWYEIAVRMKWSPDPAVGYAEWWVDGVRKFAGSFPTLYSRNDGTASNVMFDAGHYRGTQSWTDTVYFDGVRVGPTRSSVAP
jgi:Polysaccharide lyase